MDIEPLAGSKIQISRDISSTTYFWKNGQRSLSEYPVMAFLIFWLGGWTMGGFMTVKSLLLEGDMPLSARIFILCWLGGWACGEAAVIYILYNFFKPKKPAKLTLSSSYIEYETGTSPVNFFNYCRYPRSEKRSKIFKNLRNKTYRIERSFLENLQLERVAERQRLTFDVGAERVEIGETLSEPEREWLYKILRRQS